MLLSAGTVIGARAPLTSFVGRRHELGQLRSLIESARLVTITGPGGSGKTRLAEELAGGIARSLEGGVAFAYLANVTAPGEVIDVVAGAVGLRGRTGELRDILVEYLRPRRLLIAFDNCEHVRDAAATVVADLLASCPGVVVLATSRRPLLVPGEQLFPVGGLAEEAAIALFADRARRASPSFTLPDAMRPLVADLCRRLEGMPLAIELAAARTRNLGLGELVRRVSGQLADLASGTTVAPPRHRSLRGAIAWSHDLLDDDQRILWRRLCVFAGGFTLRAAEEVAALPPLGTRAIEPLLGELVDQSMVVFDGGTARYRVIEAMREFGLERLRDASETDAVAAAHRAWMVRLTDDAHRRWFGPYQGAILDELNAEGGNLRAALESSREAKAYEDGLRIAAAAVWYWITRASLAEADRWYGVFLDRVSDPAISVRAHCAAGWVAVLRGRYAEARALLDRADQLSEAAGDPLYRTYVRIITAIRAIYEQSDEDPVGLARATLADPAADTQVRCWALVVLGLAAFLRQDWAECRRVSIEGIDLCRTIGESWNQELHLRSLAFAEWRSGALEAAEAALLDALRIDRRLDDLWHRAWTIETLAWVSLPMGRFDRAARLLGIASGLWAQSGTTLIGPWRAIHDVTLAQLRQRIGDRRVDTEMAIGAASGPAAGLAFALGEDAAAAPAPVAATGTLSAREIEVAVLVANGLGNREIAERLFVSPRTVEKHVEHLMNKLGVDSRAAIAAWQARRMTESPAP